MTDQADSKVGNKESRLRLMLLRLADPLLLFWLMSFLLLMGVWAVTYNVTQMERDSAEQSTRSDVMSVADTYQAQMVRVIREIDQSMMLMIYLSELLPPAASLELLSDRQLLPPAGFFTVSVFDENGNLLVTTESDAVPPQEVIRALQAGSVPGDPVVGLPRFDPESSRWWLDFGRSTAQYVQGTGIQLVILSADAELFVSAYESDRLGALGLVGLVGENGSLRAARQQHIVRQRSGPQAGSCTGRTTDDR